MTTVGEAKKQNQTNQTKKNPTQANTRNGSLTVRSKDLQLELTLHLFAASTFCAVVGFKMKLIKVNKFPSAASSFTWSITFAKVCTTLQRPKPNPAEIKRKLYCIN